MTIQECQYEIAQEGGIFETKRLGSLSGHRHWLLTWRRAKVKLLRKIDMIEDLLESMEMKISIHRIQEQFFAKPWISIRRRKKI